MEESKDTPRGRTGSNASSDGWYSKYLDESRSDRVVTTIQAPSGDAGVNTLNTNLLFDHKLKEKSEIINSKRAQDSYMF
jgi:hypothetical protein